MLHLPVGAASSAGQECVDLAATAGLYLDPWQCDVLDGSLSERKGGKWAAFEAALIVPRQNGKNAVIEARQLGGLFLFGEPLQVHTSHEFKTTLEHFLRIRSLIENTRDLYRRVKIIRTGSADMSIELLNGQRLRFVARTTSSGRGLSGDTVYLDEAFAVSAKMLGSLVPTMRARPNPQIWYTSSPPKHDSEFLHALLKRAESSGEKRLYVAAWENPPTTALDDVAAWRRSNPAMGIRITEEAMSDELRLLGATEEGLAEFARECVGIREAPLESIGRREITPTRWAAVIDRRSQISGQLVMAVDVAPDGVAASIAVVGNRVDGIAHLEVIESGPGAGWVDGRLDGLLEAHEVAAVGVDVGGPVNILLPELERLCARRRVKLVKLPTRAYAAGCVEFAGAVAAQRVRHLDQGWLNRAIESGVRRPYGDAWVWDRRVTADISPLVAVTVARRVFAEVGPKPRMSAYEEEPMMVV